MAGDDYKVPKLNGENYHAWSIRARAALVQKRCWDAVDPGYGIEMSENERKKNDEALTLMFLIVDDTFLDDIGDCSRAREAWNALKEMHTKFGLLHVLQLMKDFFNTSMKPGETVKSYLGRLMDIHRKLASGGYAFTDREVALVMLIGLPKSYESLIINLEKDEENLTTAVVKSKLLIEEKRIFRSENMNIQNHEERALHIKNFHSAQKKPAHGKYKKWPPKKQDEEGEINQRKTKCFSCGEWGHISRYCEEAKQKRQSTAKTAIDLKNWALSVNLEKENKPNLWILDSGATEHMTSAKEKYTSFKPYTSTVEVANSEKIEVTGIGDIKLFINDENEEPRTVTLANVLYVPNLGGNLLSVGRIEELGFKVEFANGEAKVTEKNDETVFIAKRKERLYVVEEKQSIAYVARTSSEELWHRRFGHPSFNALKGMNIDFSCSKHELNPKQEELCSVCIQGKMRRLRFPKTGHTRSQDILEIIHSDVVGRITPSSLGDSNYFVTFTDEYSHYTSVYPMKTKDEVLEKFDEYRRMAEKFHGKKIKVLRSDNGGEYKSARFDNYLIKFGIRRQLSVPESPQQNGISERMNQTLINTARCLLIESGLDATFWAEAVSTAAYLRNKCPSVAITGNIPERLWTGKEVISTNLRVFGCRAWSHVRCHSRHSKLDPKAKESIFVGYPDGIKGYKLYDLKSRKFFISRDVIFEENIFPFKTKHTDTNISGKDFVTLHIENEEVLEDDTCEPEVQKLRANSEQILDTNNLNELPIENHRAEYSDTQARNSNKYNEESPIQNTDQDESAIEEEEIDYANDTIAEEPSILSCDQQARRMTRMTKPPKYLDNYILYNATEMKAHDKIPMTVAEALSSDESKMWEEAMKSEIKNLTQAQTWELTTKPAGVKLIPSRWLFHKKKDDTGTRTKFKARLVAKGYLQVAGADFKDTFSPVIKLKSIRVLLAIAAEKQLEVHQMDITAAYLNGVLEEDLYMAQPEGCTQKGKEHLVCHLKKSLYGLRQSGRVWNTCLNDFLIKYGLKRSNADPCIYFCHLKNLIVGVYVDDLLIIGDIEEINKFKGSIKKRFTAKDLGPASQILSMQIQKEADGSYTLDQSAYVTEILETFKMTEAKYAATPLDPNMKYNKVDDEQWQKIKERSKEVPYRQAIGSLLYLTCGTRPDMAYSSTHMSQFNEKHSEEHWRGVKHILRYLKGTRHRKLKFQRTGESLQVYSDADWGGDRTDRKSYSGYLMLLAGAPVSWSSKKQSTTALSSTEAEYVAMCHTAREILWINSLLKEICAELTSSPQKVFVDNQGAIFLAKNHVTSERCKHIDIKYFFLRDLVKDQIIVFEYVPSGENLADILTKQVSKKILHDTNYGRTYLDKLNFT